MRKYKCLAMSLLLFFDVVIAQEMQTFNYPELSIQVPKTWVVIPRNILDMYEEALASMAPNVPRQSYAYGFQTGESEEWFDYPTVLIQVMDNGKLTEAQFVSLQQYTLENILNDYLLDLKNMFETMPLGKMHYDKKSEILWSKDEIEYTGEERVIKISGIIRTEHGLFQVISSASKDNYTTFEQVFISIITSVTPSANYECK